MPQIKTTITLLLGVAVAPTLSQAAIVQAELTGTVGAISATNEANESDDQAFQAILPFSVGSVATLRFRYDTDVVPTGFSTFGVFDEISLDLGGTVFFDRLSAYTVQLTNNPSSSGDPDRITVGSSGRITPILPSGWDVQAIGSLGTLVSTRAAGLTGLTSSFLTGLALPEGPLDETDFQFATSFDIESRIFGSGTSTWTTPLGTHVGQRQRLFGIFDTIRIAVIPEPSSLVLFALSVVGCGLRRRR